MSLDELRELQELQRKMDESLLGLDTLVRAKHGFKVVHKYTTKSGLKKHYWLKVQIDGENANSPMKVSKDDYNASYVGETFKRHMFSPDKKHWFYTPQDAAAYVGNSGLFGFDMRVIDL
jgi:hypothetical protein